MSDSHTTACVVLYFLRFPLNLYRTGKFILINILELCFSVPPAKLSSLLLTGIWDAFSLLLLLYFGERFYLCLFVYLSMDFPRIFF